ncbi:MAG: hypothetical protein OXI80_00935 [Caldilineaceae bacterium]|nr:hypothetical protein [Caldilineaceae bacterium]
MHFERVFEGASVLHQQRARLVRLKQPLVRIQPHRISALDPAQEMLAAFGDRREVAVGGVDVHPDVLGRAVVGNRRQRIDRASAARACVWRRSQSG